MTKKELDHLAEKIRHANSDDGAYQHLLNVIADDIEAEFTDKTILVFRVAEFVRNFRP